MPQRMHGYASGLPLRHSNAAVPCELYPCLASFKRQGADGLYHVFAKRGSLGGIYIIGK